MKAQGEVSSDAPTLTVSQLAGYLGISRTKAYALVRSGVIPAVRLGRRVIIPRRALEAWVEEQVRLRPEELT